VPAADNGRPVTGYRIYALDTYISDGARRRAAATTACGLRPAADAAAGERGAEGAMMRAGGEGGAGDGGREEEQRGGEEAVLQGGGDGEEEALAGGEEWACVQQLGAVFPSASGPQGSLAGLIAGTRYLLRVTALSEVGESEPSPWVAVTTSPAPPPQPATPRFAVEPAGPDRSSGVAVRVTWDAVRPHEAEGKVEYQLELLECQASFGGAVADPPPADAAWRQVYSGAALGALVERLANDTPYAWRLCARNALGCSPPVHAAFSTPAKPRVLASPPAPHVPDRGRGRGRGSGRGGAPFPGNGRGAGGVAVHNGGMGRAAGGTVGGGRGRGTGAHGQPALCMPPASPLPAAFASPHPPPRPPPRTIAVCKFGAGCRSASCKFFHPERHGQGEACRAPVAADPPPPAADTSKSGVEARRTAKQGASASHGAAGAHGVGGAGAKACKFGARCKIPTCAYMHAPGTHTSPANTEVAHIQSLGSLAALNQGGQTSGAGVAGAGVAGVAGVAAGGCGATSLPPSMATLEEIEKRLLTQQPVTPIMSASAPAAGGGRGPLRSRSVMRARGRGRGYGAR